jgi:hypothetical protein
MKNTKSAKSSPKSNRKQVAKIAVDETTAIAASIIVNRGEPVNVDTKPVDVVKGETPEATPENVVADDCRALDIAPPVDIAPVEMKNIPDCFESSVPTWNSKGEAVGLTLKNNLLARYDVISCPLTVNGVETRYSILKCSDNGAIVGKPFASSYGLITNTQLLDIVGQIDSELAKMGKRLNVVGAGTYMGRERQSITLEIEGASEMEVDGRKIQQFLNVLNSLPSNAGCLITFSNNSFIVCCRNTFARCLRCPDGTEFHAGIKHTKKARAILEDIPKMVAYFISGQEEMKKDFKHFASFPVGLVDCEEIFAAFVASKGTLSTRTANMVTRLQELFVRGKGNKGETAFDLFNACTEYYTHESAGESETPDKQWQSSENGSGATKKQEFFNLLLKATAATANFQAVCKIGKELLVSYRSKVK